MERSIDAHTRLVALLGDPVEHSLSPLIHNSAFAAQKLNFAYAALRVERERVRDAVRGLLALNFVGANVTVPHKQAVVPHLDRLSPQAEAVGAVNTIVCCARDGALIGDNTDVAGFLAPLLDLADRLRGARMMILGSGGAARAIAYALLTTFEPARLTLAARTPSKARRLAADLSQHDVRGALDMESMESAEAAVRSARLIVNATPLGMHPAVSDSPWPNADDFTSEHIVYDVVYNPEETRLLRAAAARGAATIGGLEMLVGQAAASYALWTGQEMPIDAVKTALRKHQEV